MEVELPNCKVPYGLITDKEYEQRLEGTSPNSLLYLKPHACRVGQNYSMIPNNNGIEFPTN